MNKELEMIALISKCETAIQGLRSLLNMPERFKDRSGIDWFETGHGQIAIDVLEEIREFKKSNGSTN